MTKKRLLKDLPFGNLTKGTVLTEGNGGFYVDRGETIYKEGGSSSNGGVTLEGTEIEVVQMIWENPAWFTDATVPNLAMKVSTSKIEITFAPLDLKQAQDLAKGIRNCLQNFGNEEQKYVWQEFKGFTISLS